MMPHPIDWKKFRPPWDRIGPELQRHLAEDVRRIVAGRPPAPPPETTPAAYGKMSGYAKWPRP